MEKQQSMAKGFSILSMAGVLNKVLGVLYVSLLMDLLGETGNGIYSAGYQIYVMVFVITNQGIPVAISKMVSGYSATGRYQDVRRTLHTAFAIMLGLGIVSMAVLALFSNELAQLIKVPYASLTVMALAPTMLFTAIASCFRGYFQGRGNMVPTAVSQVLEQLVNTIGTVVFAYLMLQVGQGVAESQGLTGTQADMIRLSYGAAGGTLGTSLGALVSCGYVTLTYWRKRRQFVAQARAARRTVQSGNTRSIAKTLLRYAIPITLGAAIVYGAGLVDTYFTMDRLINAAGFSEVDAIPLFGILTSKYQRVLYIPLALATALSTAVVPQVSRALARADRASLKGSIHNAFSLLFSIMLPAAVGMAVLAGPIFTLLFPGRISGVDMLQVGAPVLILMAFVQVQTSVLQGLGRTKAPVMHMGIALLAKIAVNYVLIGIPSVNIRGAIVGSAVCYALAAALNLRSILRATSLSFAWGRMMRPALLACVVMAPVAWGTHALGQRGMSAMGLGDVISSDIALAVAVILGVAVYFLAMCLMGALPDKAIRRVPVVGTALAGLAGRMRPHAKRAQGTGEDETDE